MQKEEMAAEAAAAALCVAKAEQLQKKEEAAAVLHEAKTQANLMFLQQEQEAAVRAARAAALQVEAKITIPNYDPGKTDSESSYNHVRADVDDQNVSQCKQEGVTRSKNPQNRE